MLVCLSKDRCYGEAPEIRISTHVYSSGAVCATKILRNVPATNKTSYQGISLWALSEAGCKSMRLGVEISSRLQCDWALGWTVAKDSGDLEQNPECGAGSGLLQASSVSPKWKSGGD